MGVAAIDCHIDVATGSGAGVKYSQPPAIHMMLSKDELEGRYGLYQGSGGNLSGIFNTTFTGAINVPSSTVSVGENKLASVVQEVCAAFSLTKDELAEVCQVQSRKTLYNWLDGKSTPRKSAMRRIFDLRVIAQAWKQAGFPSDKESIRNPVLDGESTFELLRRDNLDKELILFAGTRLNLSRSPVQSIDDPFA